MKVMKKKMITVRMVMVMKVLVSAATGAAVTKDWGGEWGRKRETGEVEWANENDRVTTTSRVIK